jgi:putative copper export protein
VVATSVPLLQSQPAILRAVARRYQQMAWSAFAVLVLTGLVNVRNAGIAWTVLLSTPAGRTLTIKLILVLLSGGAAALHAFLVAPRVAGSPTRPLRAASGVLSALSLLAAILAALYGVIIAEGT